MTDSPADIPHDEPPRGLVPIAILFVLVAALTVTCVFLWGRSLDAKLHAEIEARIHIRKAQDAAAEDRREVERLREENHELKALLDKQEESSSPPYQSVKRTGAVEAGSALPIAN